MRHEEFEEMCAGMGLVDMVGLMKRLKEEKERLEKELAEVNARYDYLRYNAVPQMMESHGINTVTMEGIGRVSLSHGVFASICREKKEEAYQYLRDIGRGDIITRTVNAQTLATVIKQMIQNGEEVPEDLFNVTPYTRASITKV